MTQTKTFTIVGNDGYEEDETWKFEEDMYCPSCGHKGLWNDGKYVLHLGAYYLCLECKTIHRIPDSYEMENTDEDKQRLEHLMVG